MSSSKEKSVLEAFEQERAYRDEVQELARQRADMRSRKTYWIVFAALVVAMIIGVGLGLKSTLQVLVDYETGLLSGKTLVAWAATFVLLPTIVGFSFLVWLWRSRPRD